MTKRFYASFLALALLGSMLSAAAFGQTKKAVTAQASQNSANDPLTSLPKSDGVVSIDMQRLLNEFLPGVLAGDQARLADINTKIDRIKTRTGLDVRAFERVAVGLRFVNTSPNSLKVESVTLARGRFDAPAMLAAGLAATKDKYKHTEQKYGGKTIYVFNGDELFAKDDVPQVAVSEEDKKAGGKPAQVADDLLQKLLNFRAGEVGIVALDANTLAIGQPAHVRAAIDASAKRGERVQPALTQLATRNPDAVLGFGANMPANLSRYLELDNDDITKNLDSIRQLYGSIGATAGGYGMQAYARTDTTAQAQGVYNTLVGFKELGGFFASNLTGDKGKLAQTALENLKITKEANEVQIRLELAQADVAMLVRVFDKRN